MKYLCRFFILFISFSIPSKINAQGSEKKLNFFGDVRFRTELDRDSEKDDGTTRDDRDRLRYRLRFGFKYTLNEHFEFSGRIRSGNSLNQQSPHVTLGKEFESDEFSIDKAYIKGKAKNGIWVWAGKNSMPFWRQNEFLWDNDVNPEGISSGGKFNFSNNSSIEPIFGYFIAGHSGANFSDDSSLSIVQLKLNHNVGQNSLVLSSGIINGSNIPDTPDDTSSFFINYNIWATSFQYNLKKLDLKLGFDYFENFKDYDNNENIADVYKNQTSAYIGSLTYTIKKFQFGLYYAHIEKFAVIDFFAQDDWVRWGNNNFTRSSNFSGQEIRIIYNINKQFNTVLRTYFAKGIKTTGVNLETGTRFRLDFNIKF